MKKRHRGQHLAAGRRGELKELTRGDCGSQRKLAAACRKVSRRAAVARSKRNVFRKIRTQGNCGPWKELATAGRRMTHSTKVARARGHYRKRYDQNNVVQETQKGQTFGKTLEGPRMKQWHKGPRPKAAYMRQQTNKGPRRQTVAMPEEGEDNHKRHRRVELWTAITSEKWRNAQENLMRFMDQKS
jgi:hypothetical protein